jgi:hypothetical protein
LLSPEAIDLKSKLSHVLWIGGPPDGGKTTIADLLGATYGLATYHFDLHEMDHIRRADPVRHPYLSALGQWLATMDERNFVEFLWVKRTPEEMAKTTMASWSERVSLVVEDLLALPTDRPIIAEGAGFFPDVILPLISDPHQAIWLAPTEDFKRASHTRRDKGAYRARILDDPETAQRNNIARDLLIAEHYRQAIRELGLPLIEVDGTRSAEEVAAEVARHFEPLLPKLNSSISVS